MIDNIIAQLSRVKGHNGRWTACCPAHNDKSPSLAIRQADDGRILLHCFGGCSVQSIVSSLGMEMTDLFPPDEKRKQYPVEGKKPLRPKFFSSDVLRVIHQEALIVSIVAADIVAGKKVSEADSKRVQLAFERIDEGLHYAN